MTLKTLHGVEFEVDPEDFDRVAKFTWFKNCAGHIVRFKEGNFEYLARFILGKEGKIEYVNGNKNDLTRRNIRLLNKSLRKIEAKLENGEESGLTWDRRRERWLVRVKHRGESIFVGRFKDKKEAKLNLERANLEISLFGRQEKR